MINFDDFIKSMIEGFGGALGATLGGFISYLIIIAWNKMKQSHMYIPLFMKIKRIIYRFHPKEEAYEFIKSSHWSEYKSIQEFYEDFVLERGNRRFDSDILELLDKSRRASFHRTEITKATEPRKSHLEEELKQRLIEFNETKEKLLNKYC